MAKIGFTGLGHMGTPMVRNLLAANHEVKVYDLVQEAIDKLVSDGAVAASSLADVSQDVDVIFTMLQTGEQVKDVCLAQDGLFEHARADTLFIDSSSIAVDASRQLHKAAVAHGLRMLDAPVSGGVASAAAGTLTVMVGGEAQVFAQAKSLLETFGKKVIHAGRAGNGQVAKICNNMILGISMIAVSEAFTLGEKLGLDPEKFFEISANASGQCWVMTNYSPVPGLVDNVPANNNYQPGFTANMMLKDLRLSQDVAASVGFHTALGEKATQLYVDFVDQGNGQTDFSAIIKLVAAQQ